MDISKTQFIVLLEYVSRAIAYLPQGKIWHLSQATDTHPIIAN